MKSKLIFRGQQSPFIQYLVPPESGKHTDSLVYILIVLIGALLTQACHHRVAPATEPGSTRKLSNDSTVTKPGGSTGPDGQVGVFKTLRITYAPTNFQQIQYDADGKPVQYASKSIYILGGNSIVQQRTYQFLYGPDGRLKRVNTVGGGYVLYKYNTGGPVQYTEEYTANGGQRVLRVYSYSDDNRLIGVDQRRADSSPPTHRTYQYDARGNLILISDFVMNPQFNYVLETTTSFENYDDGKHVENLLTEFPYLPGVAFRRNNFRTKVVRYKDGREISRETYAYIYNEQGLPARKLSRGSGGTFTASYTY